jgi:hypothetical protein
METTRLLSRENAGCKAQYVHRPLQVHRLSCGEHNSIRR